jgi:antitoxin Phd
MKSISIEIDNSKLFGLIEDLLIRPIRVEVNGEALAILINSERFYELVEAEEEIEDLRAYDESIKDSSPNIPWDEVKRDLGLS